MTRLSSNGNLAMTTRDEEALLARLHNDHVHKFVVRTEDKLREHFAGAIEAARARGLAPVFDFEPGDDDDDLVEPVPQRRQRKRSLVKVCEAARKAGADRVIVDGVVIAFSSVAAETESDVNEWDAVLPEVDLGPH
jgi:hypothetical protein